MLKEWQGLADIERPGQETKAGQNGSRRDAAKDIEDEQGSNAMNGALNEDEGPDASNTNAYPKKGGSQRDAEDK
jgi:hypothetical protein